MQSEINIKVGNKPPKEYFGLIKSQIAQQNLHLSGIDSEDALAQNLKMNCVPPVLVEMGIENYAEFLALRRIQMAEKIRAYYFSL